MNTARNNKKKEITKTNSIKLTSGAGLGDSPSSSEGNLGKGEISSKPKAAEKQQKKQFGYIGSKYVGTKKDLVKMSNDQNRQQTLMKRDTLNSADNKN